MVRNSDKANGIEIKRVQISATACVISTPVRPNKRGRMRIAGIKQIPFLEEAVMDAFTPFPIDCSIIFVITMTE